MLTNQFAPQPPSPPAYERMTHISHTWVPPFPTTPQSPVGAQCSSHSTAVNIACGHLYSEIKSSVKLDNIIVSDHNIFYVNFRRHRCRHNPGSNNKGVILPLEDHKEGQKNSFKLTFKYYFFIFTIKQRQQIIYHFQSIESFCLTTY